MSYFYLIYIDKKYNVLPSKYGNLSIKKGHKMIMSIVTIRGLYVLYRYPWLQFYRGNFSKFNIYLQYSILFVFKNNFPTYLPLPKLPHYYLLVSFHSLPAIYFLMWSQFVPLGVTIVPIPNRVQYRLSVFSNALFILAQAY